jgi:hypothetical protein
LASWVKPAKEAAIIAVFFCVKLFSSSLCWAGWSTRKGGRSVYRYANSTQSDTMIGVMLSGLNNLNRGHKMATINTSNHVQTPTKTALFNLYHTRKPINGVFALRFNRRYPVSIVKFTGFEGGVM